MKNPAYPSYSPTEAESFQELPDGWTLRRLRFLVHGIDQGWSPQASNMPAEEGEIGVLKLSAVGCGEFYPGENKHLEEIPAGQVVLTPKAQDILMTRANTPALVGDVCFVTEDFPDLIIPDLIYRLKVDHTQVAPRFLMYALLSRSGRAQIESLARGSSASMVKLGQSHLKDFQIPLPTCEEQGQVIEFLDRKTGQIDALIAKKTELVEKLKEKRRAIITQAVTKGLNHSAHMRNSGIDWLGKVPAPWGVRRLKFVAKVGNGSTPDRENSEYWDGDYPWLNSSVVNQEVVTTAEEFVTSKALAECHLPKIQPPVVLVGITGQGRTRGMASTLNFEATINQHLAFIKPEPDMVEVSYLRRVFDIAYAYLRSESDGGGSTKGAITCEQISEMPLPVPPLEEQKEITAYLAPRLEVIDRMMKSVESAIARLSEYRTALITAATTGQIDVSGTLVGPVA